MNDEENPLELFRFVEEVPLNAVAKSFEPARLTQARVLAWLTKSELAESIGVSAAAVGQYEAGAATPRVEQLRALSDELSVPIEFFASGRPLGRLDTANIHFRSLRSTRAKDRAKAAVHAEQVWELVYALEKQVQFPLVDLPEVPEGVTPVEAAQILRAHWGISSGPVPHLVATMEAHGLVVSLISLTNEAVTRVKAYSTDALGRPIVVVTPERYKSVYEYRFTCAHEIGHLLLHPNPLPGDRQQEREADQFAAELLTPSSEITPSLPTTIRIAALDELSKTWGVSVESLIYRMGELQLVSSSSIRRAHQRLAQMAEFRPSEPLSAYPGEVPSLVKEALNLSKQHGYEVGKLAGDLCWRVSHVAEVLGADDRRPELRVV